MRDNLLCFPPFLLNLTSARLQKGRREIPLPPKEFALLSYLASNPGRLISSEELLRAIWPGVTVTPGVLKVRIRRVRLALGDNPEKPRFIETVRGRGYRFIAPLREEARGLGLETSPPSPQAPSLKPPVSSFVGREAELAQLHQYGEKAWNGERQIVFVTGEPGIGKTTLVEAFLARAVSSSKFQVPSSTSPLPSSQSSALSPQPCSSPTPNTQYPTPVPWIAWGQCIEHYGAGEAYMPVLEALGRLGGTPEGERLKTVLNQYAPTWLAQLPALLTAPEQEALQRRVLGATRERMLREFAEALEVLTTERALVLVLEDLHWADVSTLELLALLARRREPARLLVLGTYRPMEVLGNGHPLNSMVRELRAHGLCMETALPPLREEDIEAYLQQRFPRQVFPTRLAQVLHRRTEGNPLFVVSVIDEWVAQSIVAQIEENWVLQGAIESLETGVPESIRHLVARQRERLPLEDQQVLEAASVAGIEFSAAAVAAVLEVEIIAIGDRCARLAERQQFLRPAGIAEWPDGTVAARYGFIHALYQHLWHERVSIERQQQWHLRIGERQEAAYGSRASEIAVELAVHFEQGRDYRRAVQYLQQAGENALRRSASAEAISYFTKGLEVLHRLPNSPERARQELLVQVSLGPVLMMTNGRSAAVVENAYARALALCQQTGESSQLFSALRGLWECYEARGELQKAHDLAEQFFTAAQNGQDPARLLIAHDALGDTLFWRGELILAREHLEQGVTLYNPQQHSSLAFFHGGYDPGVACASLGACVTWLLGYADQALARMRAALMLARKLGHLHSLASALIWAAVLHQLRREERLAQERTEATIPLCREQGFPFYLAAGTIMQGWARAEQGEGEEGIAQIRQGLATCRALGVEMARTYFLGLLAGAYGKAGQSEEGLKALDEALELVNTNGECLCEAELWRLKGELTLTQSRAPRLGSRVKKGLRFNVQRATLRNSSTQYLAPNTQAKADAEACFLRAIEIARRQQAKALELRAVMSLSRLWAQQGKKADAQQRLAEIYSWFTEGFDTKDLQEAKALLEELS